MRIVKRVLAIHVHVPDRPPVAADTPKYPLGGIFVTPSNLTQRS